jgi:CheY-like chemotaxis protein
MNQATIADEKITYLVVDDEITISESRKQNFIDELNFPGAIAKFAASCDEALNILNKNSDINLCFLDIKLPKTSREVYDYEPQASPGLGMSLIPKILELNNKISLILFSAYIDKSELKQTADSLGIMGYLRKDDPPEEYRNAFIRAIGLASPQEVKLDNLQIGSDIAKTNRQKKVGSFDYGQLDSKTQSFILEKTELIKKLLKRTVQDIIDIGKYLTEVKQSLPHGQFYPWLKSEFPWGNKTAASFMKVYHRFKSVNISDLNVVAPSVLYLLASDNVSDDSIRETIRLAKSGTNITARNVRSILEQIDSKQQPKNIVDVQSTEQNSIETDDSVKNISEPIVKKTVDSNLAEDEIKDAKITSTKQDIIKVIPRQHFWQLDRHVIFCADPNSTKFIEQLPSKIDLCLAFPPSKNWLFQFDRCESYLNYFTLHQDLDHLMLMESIDRIIQISTNEQDNIVVCFIPHPMILSIIHTLECNAYVVDSDYDKCLGLVDFFSQMQSTVN